MIEQKIKNQLKEILKVMKLPDDGVDLEHPADESHGDFASNVALLLAKKAQKNPGELAKRIAEQLKKVLRLPGGSHAAKRAQDDKLALEEFSKLVKKVEVAGPGFINFTLSDDFLLEEMNRVYTSKNSAGLGKSLLKKKLMVEFAHPNTHKQFHIGHLRNISLGESLVRLLESQGAKVIRTNYQGDVGLHVAKALWGVQKLGLPKSKMKPAEQMKFLGKAYVAGNDAYEEDEKSKKQIQELNKKIYLMDPSIIPLWKKTRAWSLAYFTSIYARVYTHYDRLFFESEVAEPGKKKAVEALKKGILKKSQGAVVFDGEPYGLHTRVFLTKEDLPTYEGKELGLASLEFSEFGEIDQCIHVVGPEQKSFFSVTFKVEELLDPEKFKGKQEHFAYGYVQLKSGKMSSRKGNVVTGEWLLDEAKKRVLQIMKDSDLEGKKKDEVSEMVAVAAVKYAMLKVSPVKDIAFDFDESVSFEGNSGPYLQYTYARARSVLGKVKTSTFKGSTFKGMKFAREEQAILRWLYRYPEVVKQAAKEYAPSVVCTYLFELAQRFNTFYNKHSILRADSSDQVEFRLALSASVAQILYNGLYLLGIKAPKKM